MPPSQSACAMPDDPRTDGPTVCRVVHDPALPGAWNMAVDESLLASAADQGLATLRTYSWSEPTLTLGYFQRYEDRYQHPASVRCTCVRRNTGGGAILHDQEITYSLVIPLRRETMDTRHYYQLVHTCLRAVLAEFGIGVDLFDAPVRSTSTPFLCFQRRSTGDVVYGRHKILGSAQRRRGPALLQHGSLLLARSPHAPELPGLWDLIPEPDHRPTPEELIRHLSHSICNLMGASPLPGELTPAERDGAVRWVISRFGSDPWNQRR